MRKVVLPQAFRRMLPPLGNNAIAIVKDSSLASAIGLAELAYAARTVSGAYARYWEPYLTISVIYWVTLFWRRWCAIWKPVMARGMHDEHDDQGQSTAEALRPGAHPARHRLRDQGPRSGA
jgi:ABC-type arginine transport system permease subunit